MDKRAYKYILFVITAAGAVALRADARAAENTQKQISGMIARPVVEYNAGGLRDPFLSPRRKPEEKPVAGEMEDLGPRTEKKINSISPGESFRNLKLQGMIWGGPVPQAIINGEVVTVGDKIDGVEIMKIEKEGVTLSTDVITGNLTASGGRMASPGSATIPVTPVIPVASNMPVAEKRP